MSPLRPIGVCSWSLGVVGAAAVVAAARDLGLSHVHLAVGPLLDAPAAARAEDVAALRDSGLTFTAGMIGFAGEDYSTIKQISRTGGYVPDAAWPARRERTWAAGRVCEALGIGLLTTHAGFLPAAGHAGYPTMSGRVAEVAAGLGAVTLVLETGQESAEGLLRFLADLPTPVGVNFDPANMVLYGSGEPVSALRTLGRHVRHFHAKDAVASATPGSAWGREVPVGQGQVDWLAALAALDAAGYAGPLVIEREGGADVPGDVRVAVQALRDAHGRSDVHPVR